ncbi:hypothetical protein U1Q18_037710 [Sarracenia purpurea var. burkii]
MPDPHSVVLQGKECSGGFTAGRIICYPWVYAMQQECQKQLLYKIRLKKFKDWSSLFRYTNVGKKAVVLPYIDFLVNEDGPYGSLGLLVSVKKTYQNQTLIT